MTDSEHAEAVKLLYQNAGKDTKRLLTLAGVEAPPPPPQGPVEEVRAVASKYRGEAGTLRNLLVKKAATQLRRDKVKAQYQDLSRQLRGRSKKPSSNKKKQSRKPSSKFEIEPLYRRLLRSRRLTA